MKEFYSQVKEHSSRQIREKSGKDFVRMGSQLIPQEDLEQVLQRRSSILIDPKQGSEQMPNNHQANVSTVICNHVGFIECLGLILSPLHPGFCPKIELSRVPLISTLAHGLQSIFIDRAGTEAERNKIVETIMARQIEIEDGGRSFNPIIIFPEGTTSNGD